MWKMLSKNSDDIPSRTAEKDLNTKLIAGKNTPKCTKSLEHKHRVNVVKGALKRRRAYCNDGVD